MNIDEKFYSIRQVCDKLNIHRVTVYRHIKDGRLKVFKVGGRIKISGNAIEDYLNAWSGENVPKKEEPKIENVQVEVQKPAFVPTIINTTVVVKQQEPIEPIKPVEKIEQPITKPIEPIKPVEPPVIRRINPNQNHTKDY